MKRLLEACKSIAMYFWFGAFLVGLVILIVGLKIHNSAVAITGGVFVVLILGITILVIVISDKIEYSKKKKYEDKFVEKYLIEDDYFGKISVEHDSNKHCISANIPSRRCFAGRKVEVNFPKDDDSEDIIKKIEIAKALCKNSDSLIDRIFKEFAEALVSSDTYDENGEPIEMTEEYLREKFELTSIIVENYNSVCIWGAWEGSGNQDYSIHYEIKEDKLWFELL